LLDRRGAFVTLQLATLLGRKAADDTHRLMDPRRVTQSQMWIVLALNGIVVLNECLTEQFKGPGVALDCRQAFLVSHANTCFNLEPDRPNLETQHNSCAQNTRTVSWRGTDAGIRNGVVVIMHGVLFC